MKKFLTIVIIVLLVASGFCCSKENNGGNNNPDCNGVSASFSANVNPLIQTFCNQAACHNPGSTNGPGALTTYAEVFNARAAIRGQVLAGLMPQNTTLTTTQKNTIICWIDNGAPDN